MTSNDLPSLFGGVDAAVNAALGVESYRHQATVNAMKARPPTSAIGSDVARRVYHEIAAVFPRLVENPQRRPSEENWRCYSPGWECQDNCGEVGLERAFVKACKERGRSDWWNQVPIASGLVSSSAGKRRAIDLVRHRGGRSYEFVELKIDSDTPLYATVEILQYGFAWLLSRHFRSALGYSTGTLLDADDVRLNVLAPRKYFGDIDFSAFAAGVSTAVQDIAAPQAASMAFRFVVFPEDFVWSGEYSNKALCALLDDLFIPKAFG